MNQLLPINCVFQIVSGHSIGDYLWPLTIGSGHVNLQGLVFFDKKDNGKMLRTSSKEHIHFGLHLAGNTLVCPREQSVGGKIVFQFLCLSPGSIDGGRIR